MTDPYAVTRRIVFEGYQVPYEGGPGGAFYSDRCTDAPDHLPGHHDVRPACAMHDFQRRYGVVPAWRADARLYRFLRYLGARRWEAFSYWIVVVIARRWFNTTLPLPAKWAQFAKPDPSLPNMKIPT